MSKQKLSPYDLTWVEVDLKALRYNYRQIVRLARRESRYMGPGPFDRAGEKYPQVLAVIKADAYGHGMVEAARALAQEKVAMFAVSNVDEGIVLRGSGVRKPILLLESTLPFLAKPIVQHRLVPSVLSLEFARALEGEAARARRRIPVHIKVDTGMGRLGVAYPDAGPFIRSVMKMPHLTVEGVLTHFPSADTDPALTRRQIDRLAGLVKDLRLEGCPIRYVHAANSMGLSSYKSQTFNLVRPGLMLYGLYPAPQLQKKLDLRPVLGVKSHVLMVKAIAEGTGISYGHTFVAKKKMSVATVAIGYQDGYLRSLSNRSSVLIRGRLCPVLGRVTMDQIVVDVTGMKGVRPGTVVTVLGREGKNEISADTLASLAGTISYEVVCSLGNRLPRIYKK